jgi:PAS domain S-box-containing protein
MLRRRNRERCRNTILKLTNRHADATRGPHPDTMALHRLPWNARPLPVAPGQEHEGAVPPMNRLPPPARTFLVSMLAMAIVGAGIIVLISRFRASVTPWTVTALDVFLLCCSVSPVLWFLVVRPVRTRAQRETARSQAIIDTSSDAIVTVGSTGAIASFNPAATRMFGWAERDVIGRPFDILVAEPERPRHRGQFDASVRDPKGAFPRVLGEVPSVRRDGSTFVADLTLGAFESGDGLTIAAFLRDATERQLVRERVESQQRYYQSLLAQSVDIIAVATVDGRLEYANPALERALGGRLDDWLRHSVFDLVWPADLEQARATFERTLCSDGEPVAWRMRLRHTDGSPRWFEGTARRAASTSPGIVVNCRDVTDRKTMDDRLTTLSLAIDQSPASVVITDPAGNIEYVNPKFCALTGYTFDEVRGRNPRFLASGRTPPETYRQLWSEVLAGREWRGHFSNKKKSGEPYLERASISPIVDDQGRITHLLAVKEDLTERERAKAQLAVSEERFEQVFANAPIGMALVAPDGRWLRVNHVLCQLLGYSPAELLARTTHELTHPDDVDVADSRQILDGETATLEVEKRYLHRDGHVIWAQLNVSLVVDADGHPLYFISQIQDITARKRAHETLEQWATQLTAANRKLHEEQAARAKMESEIRLLQKLEAVGQLAAGIAHEINTPMQYIGDSARFLAKAFGDVCQALVAYQQALERFEGAPKHSEVMAEIARVREDIDLDFAQEEIPRALERVLDGTGRVTGIVRAMKEFAHPDQSELRAADLNHMLETTLTVARNEYKHVAEVETDWGDLPPIPCNVGEMNQVFLNLVVNAAHAVGDVMARTQGKGRITIRTRMDGAWAVVEIADTGGGIPEAIRERVFDPFFTTKPVGKGTGQGLAIARSIVVDRHGGSLAFTSDVGVGTTFSIRLPVEQHQENQEVA